MRETLTAVYENGVFRPLQTPDVQEGTTVQLVVSTHSVQNSETTDTTSYVVPEESVRQLPRTNMGEVNHEHPLKLQRITLEPEAVELDNNGIIKHSHSVTVDTFTEDLGNGVKFLMVKIPSGAFMMGSPIYERGRGTNERLPHLVEVDSFYMGMMPVTQEIYNSLMRINPSSFKGRNHPVEMVSRNKAIKFCNRLAQKTGRAYRLPNEAEWEYACRAGSNRAFNVGPILISEIANYDARSSYVNGIEGTCRQRTTPVGSFIPNAFGLFDMHGNVSELCTGDETLVRGGSWNSSLGKCRSASRAKIPHPSYQFNFVGFRLACSTP